MKNNIFTSILTLILGLMLIFLSEDIIKTVIQFAGLFIMILSAFNAYQSYKNESKIELTYHILTIILGLVIFTSPVTIASIIPFVIGCWLTLKSLVRLEVITHTYIKESPTYKRSLIINIVSLIAGVLLIFNPFKGVSMMLKIIGIILSIYSIAQFFDYKDDKPKKVKVIE